MSSRAPSQPPQLPGYEYESLLGSGGFADVFRYRQLRPQRRVAIKVLLSDVLDDTVRHQFETEANVMATMSTHPSIVSIYAAEVSDDDRPYIVMEYCSRPNYGVRFRKERITVAEVLRVGVQVAGAVETAHRAGILHRDIKPANILVTDYNRPALTDFGISIATAQGHNVDDSQGMSIPWSPPEFFADPPRADVRSDVFSLAATVYSLLASQTPFERRGQRNTASDLIHRIATEPLPPLNRPDVPPELNRVLAIAMAKQPESRYDTALAFGRGLQQVELALQLPVTQMDVLDERGSAPAPHGDEADLDQHTRVRRVSTVDPDSRGTGTRDGKPPIDPYAGVAPALGSPSVSPARPAVDQAEESTMLRPAGAALGVSSGPSPLAAPADEPEPAPAAKTPAWPFVTLAAVLVIALGVGATFAVNHFLKEEPDPIATSDVNVVSDAEPPEPPHSQGASVIVPEEGGGQRGKVRVSWELPANAREGDFFQVRWKDMPSNYEQYAAWQPVQGRQSHVMDIPPGLSGRCVEIRTATPNGNASEPVEACIDGG